MTYRIYLDMDGVLADWTSSVCAHFNKCTSLVTAIDTVQAQLGIPEKELTELMLNPDFWSSLSKTTEADFIVNRAIEFYNLANVYILSNPGKAYAHSAIKGKMEWLEEHYPLLLDKVVFTRHKELLANSKSILVDDFHHHVDAFIAHGGIGVLVPRQYNRARNFNTLDILRDFFS